ncbi:hypothetical protein EJ08DRAFT_701425 [Tothia fuscella]|uniref:Uncharacterized protein n=1 Tax=Tothia fuscella TaxID=1048955 RepID=A0A9P4TUW4_9PEZI|nr:hypothetical protein EJ08DRAFT_701425 [Tothia fuscella]
MAVFTDLSAELILKITNYLVLDQPLRTMYDPTTPGGRKTWENDDSYRRRIVWRAKSARWRPCCQIESTRKPYHHAFFWTSREYQRCYNDSMERYSIHTFSTDRWSNNSNLHREIMTWYVSLLIKNVERVAVRSTKWFDKTKDWSDALKIWLPCFEKLVEFGLVWDNGNDITELKGCKAMGREIANAVDCLQVYTVDCCKEKTIRFEKVDGQWLSEKSLKKTKIKEIQDWVDALPSNSSTTSHLTETLSSSS